MYTLNIFPGISHSDLLTLLSRARRDSAWDSLRLVGLHPEDVEVVQPTLLHFLVEAQLKGEHHWNSLLLFWLVPSKELEDFIQAILGLHIFHAVYFKCPSPTSPILPTTASSMSLPPNIISAAIMSPAVEKITFCNSHMNVECAQLFRDEVRKRYAETTQMSPVPVEVSTTTTTDKTPALDKWEQTPLRTLEFVTCVFHDSAFPFIADAIQNLHTLDSLKFWYCELPYQHQCLLLQSLHDHPSLTRLDWMERVILWSDRGGEEETGEGDTTSGAVSPVPLPPPPELSLEEALDRTLSSSKCRIRVLGLSVGSLATVGSLLSKLTTNDSVEWLDLSYNGTSRASMTSKQVSEDRVFGKLCKFRNLHNLDLFCTRLSSSAFSSLIGNPILTLEHISCWGDDLWEGSQADHVDTVLKILKSHPNFVEFYGGLHWRTPMVQFLFDIRKVYRCTKIKKDQKQQQTMLGNATQPDTMILEEEKDVAPCLWPLILERPNRLLPSRQRQFRALFWLLHQGPAFSALPLNHYG